MKAAGMLFLSRTPPALAKDNNGQVEPWKLVWKGQQAADWLDAHRARLLPGAVLCAVVDNIRVRTAGSISEVTAKVQQCWMVDKGVQHG
jgi:hypothetical protein